MSNLIWLFIPVSLITTGALHYNRWRGFLTLGIIGAVWLFLSLTLSVSTHHHAYAQIQAIESARSAYLTQTATPESERYAISMWAIESNSKIAVMKYYSQHPALRFFWPDEVGKLTYIMGGGDDLCRHD